MSYFQEVTGKQKLLFTKHLVIGAAFEHSVDATANDDTFTAATTDIITEVAHGMSTGDLLHLTNSGGALPAGLAVDTDYYCIKLTNDTYSVATTKALADAGTAVDITGTGTGTHTSHKPFLAVYAPSAGEVARINQIQMVLVDTAGMTQALFGSGTALTSGVRVLVQRDGQIVADLTDTLARAILNNADFGRFMYDVSIMDLDTGPTNEILLARWHFLEGGRNIRLIGDDSEQLVVWLNDDLSGLVSLHFVIKGYREDIESDGSVL